MSIAADGALFAVGHLAMVRRVGRQWTAYHDYAPLLNDVWARNATDAWAVGDAGVILRFNGVNWLPVDSGTTADIRGVWGRSADDIWAATNAGILHWNGSVWAPAYAPADEEFHDVWGTSATDVWAVGTVFGETGHVHHFDGSGWSLVTTSSFGALYRLSGTSSSDVWAGGAAGGLMHWNGTEWLSVPVAGINFIVRSIKLSTPSDGWLVANTAPNQKVYRWNGSDWVLHSSSAQVPSEVLDIDVSSDGQTWASGRRGHILRLDGTSWTDVTTGPGLEGISDAFAYGDNVWIASLTGKILHWTGSTWLDEAPPNSLQWHSIHGSSDKIIWAVGEAGNILRWNGLTWSSVASPTTQALWGVFASQQGGLAWAVGDNGTVLKWDGSKWTSVASPTSNRLTGVWAPLSDVWVTSATGEVFRFVSGQWQPVPTGTAQSLTAICATSDTEVIAVGWGSTILRWTGGSTFASVSSNVTDDYNDVTCQNGVITIAGEGGHIVVGQAGTGAFYLQEFMTDVPLHAVCTSGSTAWAGGEHVLLKRP